jgi:hypothetical protein
MHAAVLDALKCPAWVSQHFCPEHCKSWMWRKQQIVEELKKQTADSEVLLVVAQTPEMSNCKPSANAMDRKPSTDNAINPVRREHN